MQPKRQIYSDAPDTIPVPENFRHRRIEFILRPLDEEEETTKRSSPSFNIAEVDRIEIPTREERNARR